MISINEIDKGNAFDWGRVSSDYAKYRDIYPPEFYNKIIEMGLCIKGQKVLDLGTGTGVLPRNLYKYGAEFIGADISENQIKHARLLSEEAGMNIKFVVASAETFDFPDNSFDVVTACQCFMYFDKAIALPRIYNVLKENGYFCILFMSWLPDESEIALNSEKLVLKYNPDWTGSGMNRNSFAEEPKELMELFEISSSEAFDINLPFTRESWHGRIRACRGVGASSLSAQDLSAFEKEHFEYMNNVPDSFDILHYATILKLSKKQND
jgi:SAM-dependent methyltransferase